MPVPCSKLTKSPSKALTLKLYPKDLKGCSHSVPSKSFPKNFLIIFDSSMPISSNTWFFNSSAITNFSPIFAKDFSLVLMISIKEYSRSLPYATARLPGIVQGVVVQITIFVSTNSLIKLLVTLNFT